MVHNRRNRVAGGVEKRLKLMGVVGPAGEERMSAARRSRRAALGRLGVGLFGLMSFKPFWDQDWGPHGPGWLPFNSAAVWIVLAVWSAFVVSGLYGIVMSVRRHKSRPPVRDSFIAD